MDSDSPQGSVSGDDVDPYSQVYSPETRDFYAMESEDEGGYASPRRGNEEEDADELMSEVSSVVDEQMSEDGEYEDAIEEQQNGIPAHDSGLPSTSAQPSSPRRSRKQPAAVSPSKPSSSSAHRSPSLPSRPRSRAGSRQPPTDEEMEEAANRRNSLRSSKSHSRAGSTAPLSDEEMDVASGRRLSLRSTKSGGRQVYSDDSDATVPLRHRSGSHSRCSSRAPLTDEEKTAAEDRRKSLRSSSMARSLNGDDDRRSPSRSRAGSRGPSYRDPTEEEIIAAESRMRTLRSSASRNLGGEEDGEESDTASHHSSNRRDRSRSRVSSRVPDSDDEATGSRSRHSSVSRRMSGDEAGGESDSSSGNSNGSSVPAKKRRQSKTTKTPRSTAAKMSASSATAGPSKRKQPEASTRTEPSGPRKPIGRPPNDPINGAIKKYTPEQKLKKRIYHREYARKQAAEKKAREAAAARLLAGTSDNESEDEDQAQPSTSRGRSRTPKLNTNGGLQSPPRHASTSKPAAFVPSPAAARLAAYARRSSPHAAGSSHTVNYSIARDDKPTVRGASLATSRLTALANKMSDDEMARPSTSKATASGYASRASSAGSSVIIMSSTSRQSSATRQKKKMSPKDRAGMASTSAGKQSGGNSTCTLSSDEEEEIKPQPRKRREDRQFSPVTKVWARKKANPPVNSSAGSSRGRSATPAADRAKSRERSQTPCSSRPKIAKGGARRDRSGSRGRTASEIRKDELRLRDANLLRHFDLHYPGKIYCLAKKGTVNEYGGKDFVQEIKDQGVETLADWRKRAAEMEKEGRSYIEDYVVGCAKFDGLWDEAERNMDVKILMKYGGFPKGYWMVYNTAEHSAEGLRAIQEFRWRQEILSKVEVAMRKECEDRGEDFDKMYPEVFLKMVKGRGIVDGYAMDKRNENRTMLRAREATINACLKAVNLPPIILENWTGSTRDDDNVLDFIWTNYIHPSKKVQRALSKADHTLTHRCNDECACNDADEVSKDCNCQKTKCTSEMQIANVECGEECKCDVAFCASRVVQRGRQHPIVIIAHPVKGYTIRAAEFQANGEFVSEYAGDIITAHENSLLSQTYSTDLTDVIVDMEKPSNLAVHKKRLAKRGKKNRVVDDDNNEVDGHYHRAFVNSALKKGNESRYCSHHCRPNMAISVRYIERINFAFAHFGLFMTKDAQIGDELTWNYHGEQLELARKKKKPFKSDLLPACDCKSVDCMIKPWSQCTQSDNEGGDTEDEEPDYESFSEAEEELSAFEKKLKAEKAREERAKKRLSARGMLPDDEAPGTSTKGSSIENDTPPGSPQSPQL